MTSPDLVAPDGRHWPADHVKAPTCTCDPEAVRTVCHDIRNEPHFVGCPRWGTPRRALARIYRNAFDAWQWEVWDADGRGVSWGSDRTWPEALRAAQRWLRLAPTWWQ